ncbi:Uncharacterised protein [Mycobacteroides abscessus subsp. abscessus]|nr:Uncharacterised protein [Mycobacteroides abscessus subsp. abscessus]
MQPGGRNRDRSDLVCTAPGDLIALATVGDVFEEQDELTSRIGTDRCEYRGRRHPEGRDEFAIEADLVSESAGAELALGGRSRCQLGHHCVGKAARRCIAQREAKRTRHLSGSDGRCVDFDNLCVVVAACAEQSGQPVGGDVADVRGYFGG